MGSRGQHPAGGRGAARRGAQSCPGGTARDKAAARPGLRGGRLADGAPLRAARRRPDSGPARRGGPDPARLRARPRERVRRERRRGHAARAGLADRLRRRLRPPGSAGLLGGEHARRLARLRAGHGDLQHPLRARGRGARDRPRRHAGRGGPGPERPPRCPRRPVRRHPGICRCARAARSRSCSP